MARAGEGRYFRTSRGIVVIGTTNYRRVRRPFGLLPEDRLRHLWVIGKTGCGKSTLLGNLIAQDLAGGNRVAVLDPHGALVDSALEHVPRYRTGSTLVFDPTDNNSVVRFNVFRTGKKSGRDRALLCSQLISTFQAQWASNWGPRLEHVLRNGILAIAEHPQATLTLLYEFLISSERRERLLAHVTDPVVRRFWEVEYVAYGKRLQGEALAPVLNKLGAFVSNPRVRRVVGHVQSRVDIQTLVEERGALLANLSVGRLGQSAGRLLGGLLLSTILLTLMERGRSAPPVYVYVDEFQNFVNDSVATILAESRKFGIGLVLAHQYVAQLPNTLRDAVLGNVGSIVSFRLGAHDAEFLAPEFQPMVDAQMLTSMPKYEAAVRLMANGQALRAFSARTMPPVPVDTEATAAATVRAQSRQRFGISTAVADSQDRQALPPTLSP